MHGLTETLALERFLKIRVSARSGVKVTRIRTDGANIVRGRWFRARYVREIDDATEIPFAPIKEASERMRGDAGTCTNTHENARKYTKIYEDTRKMYVNT